MANPDYIKTSYLTKSRWASIWHQYYLIEQSNPVSVLEIGVGSGLLATLLAKRYSHTSLDSDPSLNPDIVGCCTNLPFADYSFDTVVAFQVLEHIPYVNAITVIQKLISISRNSVIISLPDRSVFWNSSIYVPGLRRLILSIPRPILRKPSHLYDGEHYWELETKEVPLKNFLSDLSSFCNVKNTFKCFDNPYHRFFVLGSK